MKVLDEYFMKQALKEAIYAFEKNEIPVGAVVVLNKNIIAQSHNLTKHLKDCAAHAEMQVISAAESYLKGNYLKECTLFVTLEPCIMCAGAIFLVKLGRLVFGAEAPRIYLNKVIISKESSLLLESFFRKHRNISISPII